MLPTRDAKGLDFVLTNSSDRRTTTSAVRPLVSHVSDAEDGSAMQSALYEITGQRTVPNVFIGGKHVGGCDDTVSLHQAGKLVPMLTEAGALTSTL